MKKWQDAYYSVEAALVFPVVFAVVLFIMGLFLFQYDRCLLEQDMAAQALRAAMREEEGEELDQKLQVQLSELYRDKYVMWEWLLLEIGVERGVVKTQAQGQVYFPVPGCLSYLGEAAWKTEASYEVHRISPVTLLRSCYRLK